MKKWMILLIGLTLITGCAGPASPEPTIPPVQESEDALTAEAVVEPERWVVLRATNTTTVADVLVAEGEAVRAGDLLVALDPTDAELAVQQAEAELAAAQARLAQARTGTRPEQVAILEAQLAAANAVVTQTVAQRDAHLSGETEAARAASEADLLAAGVAHDEAVETHQETMECFDVRTPWGEEEEVCPALGPYEEMARAQEEAAYAALLAARAQTDAVEGSAEAQVAAVQARVAAAVARRDVVRAQLELARSGSPVETVAAAEADVARAAAALARAQAARDNCQIRAPFDGVVVDLPGRPGGAVAAGRPVATLATLGQLRLRTTDLTELDVAQVTVGQPVVVSIDAAPGARLRGQVVRIDRQGQEHLGDVTYPAFIALDDAAPAWLRWGMTAEVALGANAASVLEAQAREISPGDVVIAEAVVVPARWGELTFTTPGEVAQVLVAPGDPVAAGDRLVDLDSTQAALAVQEAEAALHAAEAELALRRSQPRPEDVTAAEAALAAAEGELAQALALQRQLTAGGTEAQLAAVEAQLAETEARRVQLLSQLRWAEGDGDDERAERLREEIAVLEREIAAHEARRAALPRAAAADLRAAQAGVAAAVARRDVAQAQLDLVTAGSTPWEIAQAEARVERAAATLATAEVALARTVLRAPFDGTVTQIRVESGDQVAPGQGVVVMGTLDRLQVETTDLLELDIPRVVEGQPALVRVDALRDQEFAGRVAQVGLRGEVHRGDVVVPVTIRLEDEAGLRWGMTAVIEIAERPERRGISLPSVEDRPSTHQGRFFASPPPAARSE
jgi:multidrug resistance efflux pump